MNTKHLTLSSSHLSFPAFLWLCFPCSVARSGDKLAGAMFWDAGEILGAHVKALVPQSEEPFSQTPGGLHVVAVGSVIIHCWDLLREGECLTHWFIGTHTRRTGFGYGEQI